MDISQQSEEPVEASGLSRFLLVLIWVALASLIVFIASPTVEQDTQVVMAMVVVGLLFILTRFDKSPVGRILFLSLAGFIVARYLIWRSLNTLEFHDYASFSFAIVLFLAELYGVAIFLLGAFANVSPFRRQPSPLPEDQEKWPTVDVFVPSYNESSEVLETTLLAAREMSYAEGKFKVYLLDDGGTEEKCEQRDPGARAGAIARKEELQALCKELGVNYLTRKRNESAKAGNINAGMEKTDSELVLILDADHVPAQDFLLNTVGRFLLDPMLFMVQTPHFAINPDPVERNLQTYDSMPSEQEMFYAGVQYGLDHWNASSFCGSAALLRRSCLEEIGGISGQTVTEDAETALELHARGYSSEYIGRPMIAGLAPSSVQSFIIQRSRWALGMLQIFMLSNPLFKRGLSFSQRLCYMNSCMFWFFPLARIVYALAPCAFLIFGLKIYSANSESFLLFALPYLIAVLMTANFLYGRLRWPFISDVYEMLQAVHLLPAVLQAVTRPKSGKFNVTPKRESMDEDFISSLGWPVQILFLVNLAVVGVGVSRLFQGTEDLYPTAITLFWALLNTLVLAGCLGAISERRIRREETIVKVSYRGRIKGERASTNFGIVEMGNKSCWVDGSLEGEGSLRAGEFATLLVQNDSGEEDLLRVRYNGRREIEGSKPLMEFDYAPDDVEEKAARVRLMYGDSQRWVDFQARRQKRHNLLFGTAIFSFFAIRGFFSHMRILFGGGERGQKHREEVGSLMPETTNAVLVPIKPKQAPH
ncbi:MAG: UDP-forming cellulose synthase catalytic subunit [Verrucomicrobiota bacterium]